MSLLDRPRPALTQFADQPAAPLRHAHRLLVAHGLPVARVISVDVDSVLYVARDGAARTAWLTVTHGFVSVCDVPGFSAQPPGLGSGPSAAAGAAERPPF
ncbi:hypothetical protein Q5424_25980 [Conexibacter sp. JD483]|uniref:hypothetical protein n=1 Tax=unclassified Conexibacter TaxID=2627773 RepID=UPI00271AA9FB|nr:MULTISPECIES: hypothetical protein [unclassified Conexibacter]MDO8189282.1 hypothetical protein [Conexibacter sp. CPCC 205706]MDO8201960.1 hypothetical protein [Conexibacter sp. CPCC 205762]MDR9372575.1 hypothetical protein [Conexibacter sp. JD483]